MGFVLVVCLIAGLLYLLWCLFVKTVGWTIEPLFERKSREAKSTESLIQDLLNEDTDISSTAEEALVEMGKSSVNALIQALRKGNNALQNLVGLVLIKIGAPAVEPLIEELKNEDHQIRFIAAMILKDISDPRAINHLIPLLNDTNKRVRNAAEMALMPVAIKYPRAKQALEEYGKKKGAKYEFHEDGSVSIGSYEPTVDQDSCEHQPSDVVCQVVGLYRFFPSQGDIGYRYQCTKCKIWLVCDCKKEFYENYLPNYFEKFKEFNENIIFYPNVCRACRNNDENERERWNKFKRAIEYIYRKDTEFFDYCYGKPISGYEKDMQKRSKLAELQFSTETTEEGPLELSVTSLKRAKQSSSARIKKEAGEAELRQRKARQLLNDYFFRTEDIQA